MGAKEAFREAFARPRGPQHHQLVPPEGRRTLWHDTPVSRLELFEMTEKQLRSHLRHAALRSGKIEEVVQVRRETPQGLVKELGQRSPDAVAIALLNAWNDPNQLEIEVAEAFRSLGFEAARIGGPGQPDGIAHAYLSADGHGRPRRYTVILEAKSKKKDGAKVSAKDVGTSTVERHRNDYKCGHAMVIAPAFPTSHGARSALAKEIANDRAMSEAAGGKKTITLITVYDLARLVLRRPEKQIGLGELRDLFLKCRLPEESHNWVNRIAERSVAKLPLSEIIYTIHGLQKEFPCQAVTYSAVRVALVRETPPIKYEKDDFLRDLCKGMAQMAPGAIIATDRYVELDQSPDNVLVLLRTAVGDFPGQQQEGVIANGHDGPAKKTKRNPPVKSRNEPVFHTLRQRPVRPFST